jgi:hypothetical protein
MAQSLSCCHGSGYENLCFKFNLRYVRYTCKELFQLEISPKKTVLLPRQWLQEVSTPLKNQSNAKQKGHSNRAVRSAVERVVVAPISARLFLEAIREVADEERAFQVSALSECVCHVPKH